jgi:hypothetical protein
MMMLSERCMRLIVDMSVAMGEPPTQVILDAAWPVAEEERAARGDLTGGTVNWYPEEDEGLALSIRIGTDRDEDSTTEVAIETWERLTPTEAELRDNLIRYCVEHDVPYALDGHNTDDEIKDGQHRVQRLPFGRKKGK